MDYPITLERDDNETILVSFPDFPEAHTSGEDEADAVRHAADALATVIDAYVKDRRDIPLPSAIKAPVRVLSVNWRGPIPTGPNSVRRDWPF